MTNQHADVRPAGTLLAATLSLAGLCFTPGCSKEDSPQPTPIADTRTDLEITRDSFLSLLTPEPSQINSSSSGKIVITERKLDDAIEREYRLPRYYQSDEALVMRTLSVGGDERCYSAIWEKKVGGTEFSDADTQKLFAAYRASYAERQREIDQKLDQLIATRCEEAAPTFGFEQSTKRSVSTLQRFVGEMYDSEAGFTDLVVEKKFDGSYEFQATVLKGSNRGIPALERTVTSTAPWVENVFRDAEHKAELGQQLRNFIERLDFQQIMASEMEINDYKHPVFKVGEFTIEVCSYSKEFDGDKCTAQVGMAGLPYQVGVHDERIKMIHDALKRAGKLPQSG